MSFLWKFCWYPKMLVWFDNITKFKHVRSESAKRVSYPYKNNPIKSLLYVQLGIKK